MKTKAKFVVLMVLIVILNNHYTHAQWNFNGDAVGSVTSIGPTTNYDFPFITNNTEKLRIKSTGEVGIGVTSTSSWLHVKSTGTKETFRTDVPSTYDNYWRMYADGTEYGRLYHLYGGGSATGFYMVANKGNLRFGSGYGSGAGTVIPAMEITGASGTTGGNVLIGDYTATSASSRLHVKGNGYTSLFKAENSVLSTPSFEIFDNDKFNFISQGFVSGAAGDGAFSFNYTPSTTGAHLTCTSDEVYGDASTLLIGKYIDATNTNTSSATSETRGISIQTLSSTMTGTSNTGIYSFALGSDCNNYGANFQAPGPSNANNYGLFTAAGGAQNATGIYTVAQNSGGLTSPVKSMGISSRAYGSPTNIAVDAETIEDQNGNVIAVRAEAGNSGLFSGTNSWYGVWGIAPAQACSSGGCAGAAGFFSGEVFSSGAAYQSSDLKLKDQIQPLLNSSSKLALLQPKQFVYKTTTFPSLNLSEGLHFGFIAQDIETVLPELVKEFKNPEKTDSIGNIIHSSVDMKAVNYIEIIPLLVNAFNEQKLVIDSLINALQNPTPIINPTNTNKIQLSNSTGFILNQNDPNPFTESTVITYNIPEAVNSAKIIFTNSTGVIINTIVIGERGSGQLEVYASDLSKGIYVYSLVCDGKVVASKKMVKQ